MTATRRRFLRQSTTAAAGLALGRWTTLAAPEEVKTTRVLVDPARTRADLDRRLFGSFLEHIGRAIYKGIYEPGSKLADADGFRKDTLQEVRQLGVPIIRYPGGNFVSGYNWVDGVGPKDKRPRLLDRAWNSIETNQFGTDEFITWCTLAGAEPFLAVNLGTGAPDQAAALVEYCNVEKDSRWSDLRRKHGFSSPHGVKYWCLGNEMDGPWQIGHMPAAEYGRKAADAARQMKAVDRSIQLVACGSTAPHMPTYLEWDRQVLEECYKDVDAISLHRYFNNTRDTGGDPAKFLALNLSMERQIQEVAAICDVVRGRLRSPKRLWLSFDEWNVWYREQDLDGRRQEAPHLVEEVYNLEDALLVGGALNTLLRNADRVRIACLAQLINVIAPLLTNSEKVLRQTTYYPYAMALQYARGKVLDLFVESPSYPLADAGPVPFVDVAATLDTRTGESCFLMLNRDTGRQREITLHWRDAPPASVLACQTLTGRDLKAVNRFDDPKRVIPRPLDAPRAGRTMTLRLPAQSYTALHLAGA